MSGVTAARLGGQPRRDDAPVETETRGSRPSRCEIVQVTLIPGSLTVVAARARPELLTEARVLDRAVERRRRAIRGPSPRRFSRWEYLNEASTTLLRTSSCRSAAVWCSCAFIHRE
jgi:hypothetical protein